MKTKNPACAELLACRLNFDERQLRRPWRMSDESLNERFVWVIRRPDCSSCTSDLHILLTANSIRIVIKSLWSARLLSSCSAYFVAISCNFPAQLLLATGKFWTLFNWFQLAITSYCEFVSSSSTQRRRKFLIYDCLAIFEEFLKGERFFVSSRTKSSIRNSMNFEDVIRKLSTSAFNEK